MLSICRTYRVRAASRLIWSKENIVMYKITRMFVLLIVAVLLSSAMTAVTSAQQKQATLLGTLNGHTDPVYAIAWSPDGKTLARRVRQHGAALGCRHPQGDQEVRRATNSSWPLPSPPTASSSLSGASTRRPRSGSSPAADRRRTLPTIRRGRGPGGEARRQAGRWPRRRSRQDLGPGQPARRSRTWRATPARSSRRLAAGRGPARHRRQGPHDPALEGGRHARRHDRDAGRHRARPRLPARKPQLVSAGSDGLARLWQLPVAEPRGSTPRAVAASPSAPTATESPPRVRDKIVRVWNAGGRHARQGDRRRRSAVIALAFKGDGTQVALGAGEQGRPDLHDATTARRSRRSTRCRRRSPRWPSAATAAQVAAAGEDKVDPGVSTPRGQEGQGAERARRRITSLAFAPQDGNLLVSASADKMAKLWNVERGQGRPRLRRPWRRGAGRQTRAATARSSSPARPTRRSRLWNVGDGKLVATLTAMAGRCQSVALSADGKRRRHRLGRPDVRFWDAATGRELQELSAHDARDRRRGDSARQQVGRLGGGGRRDPGLEAGRGPRLRRPPGAGLRRGRPPQRAPGLSRPRPTRRVKVFDVNTATSSAPSPATATPSGRSPSRRTGRRSSPARPTRRSGPGTPADGKPLLTYPAQPRAVLSLATAADNKLVGRRPGRRHGQGLRPGPDRRRQGRAARLRRARPARSWRSPSCPITPRSSPASDDKTVKLWTVLAPGGGRRTWPATAARSTASPGPRRQAGRHRRRRQDLPDLGRRKATQVPSMKPTRTSSTRSPTAPRETCSPPAATTSWSSTGTPPTARSCARASATARRSTASPSVPTARSSPRARSTRRSGSGTSPTARRCSKLDGHPDDVYSVAFSPDGKRLASIGYGGNLFVWDADGGKPLFHQKIAPGTMTYGVAWSPDGKQLAVAASDNKGYIFQVP